MKKEALQTYMRQCEALAVKAGTKGNTPVGCIIVRNDKVIAAAEEATKTKEDVSCHAEMEAIRQARKKLGKDLSGAVLISTKEPCVLCGYAIRFHGIHTVVYKDEVSHLGGVTGPFPILTTTEVPETWPPPINIVHFEE
ncbi:nucleoside deaminase [Spongiimicrobium salis]|uniref:nucleoside deaminase n=1 Tax=Spongiimicrobium salis TaxID=1667022 RepID=UPI00374D6C73